MKLLRSLSKIKLRRRLAKSYCEIVGADILWSKGYAAVCEWNWGVGHIVDSTERILSDRDFRRLTNTQLSSIWVKAGSHACGQRRSHDNLSRFIKYTLPRLTRPFNLVTSDGDASTLDFLIKSDASCLLLNPLLRYWYAQNALEPDVISNHISDEILLVYRQKVRPIPIGLDLHTLREGSMGWETYQHLQGSTEKSTVRIPKILADCCVQRGSKERLEICELLADIPEVEVLRKRIPRKEIFDLYKSYQAVLSLPGNGLDCHRTWEALSVGTPVITMRKGIGWLYRGLPVLEVDDIKSANWKDILGLVKKIKLREGHYRDRLKMSSWLGDTSFHV